MHHMDDGAKPHFASADGMGESLQTETVSCLQRVNGGIEELGGDRHGLARPECVA